MRKKKAGAIAIKSFAMLVVLGTAHLGMGNQAIAQDAKTAYPSMAPIEQYLMDRTAEIALARSAAPESISDDAEILVLGRHGFETAVKGKNGFVCIVERSWTDSTCPIRTDRFSRILFALAGVQLRPGTLICNL